MSDFKGRRPASWTTPHRMVGPAGLEPENWWERWGSNPRESPVKSRVRLPLRYAPRTCTTRAPAPCAADDNSRNALCIFQFLPLSGLYVHSTASSASMANVPSVLSHFWPPSVCGAREDNADRIAAHFTHWPTSSREPQPTCSIRTRRSSVGTTADAGEAAKSIAAFSTIRAQYGPNPSAN